MPHRRGFRVLHVSLACMAAALPLGACTGVKPVTGPLTTRATTTTSVPDSSPAALKQAWFAARRPIAAARNISYDTEVSMKWPGGNQQARITIAELIDAEHRIAEQFTYGDLVSPGRSPRSFAAKIVSVGSADTYVSIRRANGPLIWQKMANHTSAVALLPIDVAPASALPVVLQGFEPQSLVLREYGHLCIKGALPAQSGLMALGFGRWLRLDPDLARRLTGRVPTTIVLREDGSIAKVEVTGDGHTLATNAKPAFDARLASAVSGSESVLEMGTYDVDMNIEVPRVGRATT